MLIGRTWIIFETSLVFLWSLVFIRRWTEKLLRPTTLILFMLLLRWLLLLLWTDHNWLASEHVSLLNSLQQLIYLILLLMIVIIFQLMVIILVHLVNIFILRFDVTTGQKFIGDIVVRSHFKELSSILVRRLITWKVNILFLLHKSWWWCLLESHGPLFSDHFFWRLH